MKAKDINEVRDKVEIQKNQTVLQNVDITTFTLNAYHTGKMISTFLTSLDSDASPGEFVSHYRNSSFSGSMELVVFYFHRCLRHIFYEEEL